MTEEKVVCSVTRNQKPPGICSTCDHIKPHTRRASCSYKCHLLDTNHTCYPAVVNGFVE